MKRAVSRALLASVALQSAACVASGSLPGSPETSLTGKAPVSWRLDLGATIDDADNVVFRVWSANATKIKVYIYADPFGHAEVAYYTLHADPATHTWSTGVPLATLASRGVDTIYYGYRAWGPNWPYDSTWKKGSLVGFVADVDAAGNRFNPNKLLLDPYALEVSHDPRTPQNTSGGIYGTGSAHRAEDSGPVAPKGIVIPRSTGEWGTKPTRPFKDEIVYEVHVRGLTMNDPSVAPELRGTFAGAAEKADYLQALGVTAIEFLPLQETQNDTNDVAVGTSGDNYWGYATLDFFAPDRRYAADKSPGGPTREFRAMVKAMHDRGIKVYSDIVFNHTGEGGLWDATGDVTSLLSFRGLDNASYYELGSNPRFFYDNTGTGANFNAANDTVRNLIVDALWYWKESLGVDGFRFDLAPVLGNTCEKGCFYFDKMPAKNALNRAVHELPVRPAAGGDGVDLIAEPWAIGGNSYQVGGFPSGWAEWNGIYRDTVRKAQNMADQNAITPKQLARRFAGSSDLYADDGRKPWHSVNFLVAHDGFTLRDLYSYDAKQNKQSWPYGPSDGGSDANLSWDQGGDPALERMAARTGLALLMLSAGVPMITGGDEMYRTQYGNNNAYNLDSDKNWLDWSNASTYADFAAFARRLVHFRAAHPALRPSEYWSGADHDGNGLKDVTWYRSDGTEADATYMADGHNHFLAFRVDGAERGDTVRSIYVAYDGAAEPVTVHLPNGSGWYRAGDTATWMEARGNFVDPGHEDLIHGSFYGMAARSVLVLIER